MRSACLSVTLAATDDQCQGLVYALGCQVVCSDSVMPSFY